MAIGLLLTITMTTLTKTVAATSSLTNGILRLCSARITMLHLQARTQDLAAITEINLNKVRAIHLATTIR